MRVKDQASWSSIGKVLRFAKPHWPLILFAVLTMGVYAAGEMAYLLMIEPFAKAVKIGWHVRVNDAQIDIEALRRLAYLAVGLAPVVASAAFLQDYLSGLLNWRLLVDLRNAVCRALMPQSLSFFENRRSGDLMSRITNDVSRAQAAFNQVFSGIPQQVMHLVMGVAAAAVASWQLLLLAVICLPIILVPLNVLARRIRRYGRKGLETLADLTDLMNQMFTGIRIIKAFKMEDAEAQEFQRVNQKLMQKMMKATVAHALSSGTIELIIRSLLAISVLLGAWWVSGAGSGWMPKLEVSQLAIFVGGSYYAFNSLRKLVKAYNQMQEVMPAADRVLELIEQVPTLRDAPDAVALPRVERGICFENVTFSYGGERVLCDVSFEVNRGETVAVVGRSGAGKSTLVALLPRFYDVTDGCVRIDGIDVRQITRDSLLDRFAIVAQQTFLFNRSIADNIRYGKRDATMDEVVRAAQMANIHDFIVTQESGYDMMCGEFGGKLSGGQRQRIAIARALLKNADILILDEAMVGLDTESEALVQEALKNLMKGRTTFLITHDLAAIQNADRILVLDAGRLIGNGRHTDLMQTCPAYRNLCALQFNTLK